MLRSRAFHVAVLMTLLAAVSSARADIAGLQSFSGGNPATSGSDQLYGWEFNVLTPISVTELGVGDFSHLGLSVSHDVGIFRASDQSLLASTTVPAGTGGTLDGDFRYVMLGSPLLLGVDTYVIVMTMPQGNQDFQSINNTSVTTAPEISYVTSEFGGGSSLAFPTTPGAFAQGLFGPNFEFASVPEPASVVMLAGGFLGVLGYGRFRRKRAA